MKLPVIQMGRWFKTLAIGSCVLSLAACGFHLRGDVIMPFKTMFIEAVNPSSPMVLELRRNLEASHVHVLDEPKQAEVILNISSERPEKQILTLDGSGRVSEYQLRYRVSLRAYDNKQREWLPAAELMLSRDFSYDDTQILAKQSEEATLYQNMRSDMVQQIMRRLSHAKPALK